MQNQSLRKKMIGFLTKIKKKRNQTINGKRRNRKKVISRNHGSIQAIQVKRSKRVVLKKNKLRFQKRIGKYQEFKQKKYQKKNQNPRKIRE